VGTLYLVATPIGNLEDVTHRALRVLRDVRLIAAEDTRQTRKLLSRYHLSTPLISYHEHNKRARCGTILQALAQGDVALVSDAGFPGLADPGDDLVLAASAAGYVVSPIPGPSAPIAALAASGLPGDRFTFLGYLPRKTADRMRILEQAARASETLIAFEVPHRLRAALRDLVQAFGGDRPAVVCRELTKVHEDVRRGTLAELAAHYAGQAPRGEITLVIAGATDEPKWDAARVRRALAARRRAGDSPSQAARAVAESSGWPRRDVYRLTTGDG
jgi:16S rRNA (cytidine1402-2'-O)-methyltransferase